jgi:ubiquinone/menaquinone biosynthesis C-methylase UbiE
LAASLVANECPFNANVAFARLISARGVYACWVGTPWDLAAAGYLEEWVPRFVPYHADLIRELTIGPAESVLVTSAGPGSEVIAAARVVGDKGLVRATDASPEMVRICQADVERAGFSAYVKCDVADAADVSNPYASGFGTTQWDEIICSFGLWQFDDRAKVLSAWASALAPNGKVGIITWGPPDSEDPSQVLAECLHDLEPNVSFRQHRINAERDRMAQMWKDAGLVMLRHTVVRHTLNFERAELFVRAMSHACTWRRVFEELGQVRMDRVAARFYERFGGPEAALSFRPAATIAIAALPGAEVTLDALPSMRVPL